MTPNSDFKTKKLMIKQQIIEIKNEIDIIEKQISKIERQKNKLLCSIDKFKSENTSMEIQIKNSKEAKIELDEVYNHVLHVKKELMKSLVLKNLSLIFGKMAFEQKIWSFS